MVNGRTAAESYKTKEVVVKPESDWIIVQNTHEPLIYQKLFDDVKRLRFVKKRPQKDGTQSMFQGLLKCVNCGGALCMRRAPSVKTFYECCKHYNFSRVDPDRSCTLRRIPEGTLISLVLADINEYIRLVSEPDFTEKLLHCAIPYRDKNINKDIDRTKRRYDEPQIITKKIVEQNALGIVDDAVFAQLIIGYQSELTNVRGTIETLYKKERAATDQKAGITLFTELIRSLIVPQNQLTRELLLRLIEKIVIHKPTGAKYGRKKGYRIDIHYKGADFWLRKCPYLQMTEINCYG
jgi:hypothetical protein